MRITLIISSLGGGGAERVVTNIANYWAERGWEITILTTSHGSRPPAYRLSTQVYHRDLGFSRTSYFPVEDTGALPTLLETYDICSPPEQSIIVADLNLIAALRKALVETRPEVVISFMDITNIRVILAGHKLGFPIIVSERCDPIQNDLGAGRELLRWRLYPRAARLTALNPDVLRHFAPIVGDRGTVIPNPVLAPDRRKARKSARKPGARTLTAMGRLTYEKGFDLLLHAFASIADRHPGWRLRVFGEGPLRSELMALSRELGLGKRVRFPGFTGQPHRAMLGSDLFVASSRSEGFGNVITEAMSCGLPVISFDCPSGPRHIIRDGVDGLLVAPNNVAALADALDRLMSDDVERTRLGANAPQVLERFGIEKVMEMWERLVVGATNTPSSAETGVAQATTS